MAHPPGLRRSGGGLPYPRSQTARAALLAPPALARGSPAHPARGPRPTRGRYPPPPKKQRQGLHKNWQETTKGGYPKLKRPACHCQEFVSSRDGTGGPSFPRQKGGKSMCIDPASMESIRVTRTGKRHKGPSRSHFGSQKVRIWSKIILGRHPKEKPPKARQNKMTRPNGRQKWGPSRKKGPRGSR